MVWQAIELSAALMRPTASGDRAEDLHQPFLAHKLERARTAELARTRGAVWADEEQLWDGEGWTIVGKT